MQLKLKSASRFSVLSQVTLVILILQIQSISKNVRID